MSQPVCPQMSVTGLVCVSGGTDPQQLAGRRLLGATTHAERFRMPSFFWCSGGRPGRGQFSPGGREGREKIRCRCLPVALKTQNHEKQMYSHTKTMCFARENQGFDGLLGPLVYT